MPSENDQTIEGLDLSRLTIPERINLAQVLWDSVIEEPDAVQLTSHQRDLLRQRLALADQDLAHGRIDRRLSWEEVMQRVREAG